MLQVLTKEGSVWNATALVDFAVALTALTAFPACDRAVPPPIAAFDVTHAGETLSVNGMPITAARLTPMPRYASMLLPDRRANSKAFEYIINDYGTYASIFDYPKSDRQIGSIADVGGQGCTNVLYGYGKKIFWIVAARKRITEFKVPKTPIKTLSADGKPSSCAMDADGDLAVGLLGGSHTHGDVVIYQHASGSGIVFTTPLSAEYFNGYDDRGNLFADGWNTSGHFQLVELPKGSSSFEPIATSNAVELPGSVQWDGTYLTVFDQDMNSMYRYTVRGTTATLKHTIQFLGSSDCAQTWIVKGLLYCADAGNEDGEVFKYPAGGSPVAVFSGNFDLPLGTVAATK